MKRKKVILDTNLWISFLISKNFNNFDMLIEEGKVVLIFSSELIEEFLDVSSRPKFERFFSDADIKNLLNLFEQYGQLFLGKTKITGCRDVKDNFLLSLAVESHADFLVTGDSDLLIIKDFYGTKILSWTEFIKLMIQ